MTQQRKTSPRFAVILTLVASLNYLPVSGIIDAEGRTFGLFALDIFDDALHLVSALWALAAALTSDRASRIFLVLFKASRLCPVHGAQAMRVLFRGIKRLVPKRIAFHLTQEHPNSPRSWGEF